MILERLGFIFGLGVWKGRPNYCDHIFILHRDKFHNISHAVLVIKGLQWLVQSRNGDVFVNNWREHFASPLLQLLNAVVSCDAEFHDIR